MDEISQNINDFESLLKNRSTYKPPALYDGSEQRKIPVKTPKDSKLSAKEVLANVSRQVKAIQNADTGACKRVCSNLDKYKKREFLPVNRIPEDIEVPQKLPTKFETQCITDTQLIDVVENAEIIDKHRGVTQEFDKTFCHKSDNDTDAQPDDSSSNSIATTDIESNKRKIYHVANKCDVVKENYNLNSQDSKIFENSDIITCDMVTVTCQNYLNDEINANTSLETQGFNNCVEVFDTSEVETDRSNSPVLNIVRRTATPPLVVDLYTFEKFEDLALPIIEEHDDLKVAKNMINSQIIGKEISILNNFTENVGRDSPVLSRIRCITTNFNKDEEEMICTCSNKCMDTDAQYSNEPIKVDEILVSSNKKTETKIKTEIKDEILFSSDEEYEYLHKNVQELPLTCALETSFYDSSDVLDKTMYVGFQTASNKSIQINTDSFTKAKSLLSDIDDEGTGTSLSELVEIFDTGIGVSENKECVKLNCKKLEYDKNPHEEEQDKNNDLKMPSASTTDFNNRIDDTIQNLSLKTLEISERNMKKEEIDKDEIFMSQIIQFKSISRNSIINNSILSSRNKDDTIGLTILEPNKEIDEDIIASQIIPFKSISRTQNIDNLCTASVSQGPILTNKGDSKRKFEGFKTASNKKIKLSDKTLARCKKVFMDIDLEDSEQVSCKSNIVEIEDDFLDGLKSRGFNISYEALVTNSEIDPTSVTNIRGNLSDQADVKKGNDCDSETHLKANEDQQRIEDVDLQICDKIILQEFEYNEMPFVETNNNAFIGFKTASNKNIVISLDAMAATKNVFKDIVTITTSNNSDNTIKTPEDASHDSDKNEHVFKKPVTGLRKPITSQSRLTIDTLEKQQCNNMSQGGNIDRERYKVQNSSKNEFIGFKTASHKEITISEQAKEKTKRFYNDLEEEEINDANKDKVNLNTEKKQINNLEDGFNCGIDTQDFLAEELTHIEHLFEDNILENRKATSPIRLGFQTASHKPIVISDRALEKSKKLFDDITNKDIDMKCHSIENRVNVCNVEIETSENTHIDNSVLATNNEKIVELNKIIKASKTLSQQNNILQNEETALTCASKIANNNMGNFEVPLVQKNINEFDKKVLESDNKKNAMSETTLENSKTVDGSTDTRTEAPMFVGFQTASAKPIPISANAMEITNKLLSEFELRDDDISFDTVYGQKKVSKLSTFVGFQTALAKSKEMFNDLNTDSDGNDKNLTDNLFDHTESKKNHQRNENTNDTHEDCTGIFLGLPGHSARNKIVNISEEALRKSKQILPDVGMYDKEYDILEKEHTRHEEKISLNFDGFQTACNKPVSISEKSLKESKKLFHYMDTYETNTNRDTPVFKGFQTASNKKVEISERALAKSKRLFDDMNLSQLDKDLKTVDIQENNFVGFQTAENKRIKVSDQASAKTKDMFKDIILEKEGDSLVNTSVFKGFQTASNKKVEISEKALAKSKKVFEDLNLSQLEKGPKIIVHEENEGGFKRAGYKNVTISAQTLPNTKNELENVEKENGRDSIQKYEATPQFKGFQTASNKKVVISENALAKCKQLFEDFNLSQLNNKDPKTEDSHLQSKKATDFNEPADFRKNAEGCFETANNKKVKVSEESLEKSKDIFKDTQNENKIKCKDKEIRNPEKARCPTNKNNAITNDVIDTQILNDFQETLNTEDFCKSTPTSKRSGSPILSCPRAKKRRFETPYRSSKKIEPKRFLAPKLAKTYNFNENYKKAKKYTLKDLENLEKDHVKISIDPYIAEFNFENLLNFVFKDKRNDYTPEIITTEDLKKIFIGSVNKKIVPDGWLDNHIKLILWKLLSYEVKFPNVMNNTCTVKNVLEQLKYRYDRELYHVQRPILRKILEKDEVASKTMVLCVAAIYVDNVSVASVNPSSQNVELLLTDGWYCVKACLDRMLVRLVASGAILVGTKIAVCGAELMNCEQGIAPWEDTSSVRLKLHGNSVRRARRRARLGPRTDLVQCSLGVARSDGGKMAATRVLVTRVYPPLYVEKLDDGSTVTLSEKLEQIRQMKYESERQNVMEKLYEEVEKEISDQESQDSEGYSNEKGGTESGSQISRNMKRSRDPDEYRSHLTKSQNRLLEDHSSRQREKLIERVRQKFQKKLEDKGLKTCRNVVPLLKVRVAGLTEKTGKVEITKGYLSVWKPSAAVQELVTEGAWIEILNVIPTGIRNSEIQLSAGRQTVFNPHKPKCDKVKHTNTLQRKCYEIKEITLNPAMSTDHNEIDTVGMIICIEPSTKEFNGQSFQNVYLADAEKNIICVNFWGGLKKFGFENVIDTGQIITCVNLQKRAGNTRKSIPQYRVTEFTYFTKTPKSKKTLEITNELTSKLSKIKEKFCEDCLVLKNNYSIFKTRDNENISPYRFDYNLPKNMATPLRNSDTNLNLTGLDFESSFNSQEISPQLLLRRKRVNEKIEKIRLDYGEPPPLSSIHIINKSKNASATYKSPLISNLERSKMAESPLQNVASPMTVNRTFVKTVNPVKLNFSGENLDESVDHFAEDFDASPPLSLDSDTLN